MWFVFKGMLFSIPILFFNAVSGFSGLTYVDDLFFALYEVILTTFAIYFYLLLDQDVSFKDGEKSLPTNFIAKLYTYKIQTHLSKKLKRFFMFTLFCWYTGALTFYIPFYALNGTISKSGFNGSVWMSGLASFSVVIVTHHVMILIGTRNFTIPLCIFYLGSFMCFMPLVVLLNEYAPSSKTYKTIFEYMLSSPTFWLSIIVTVSFVAIPFYAAKAWEFTMKSPELYSFP